MKTKNVSPEAYIAIGKERQKIYGDNTVYLENKKEFEFEFYNPTTFNVRANIYINGNPISNRGMVLRPGIRGWLDRYIDENRKFLFETYAVDGASAEVRQAIANNGNIKIEFFKEKIAPPRPFNNCKLLRSRTSLDAYTTQYSASMDSFKDYVPDDTLEFDEGNVSASAMADTALYSRSFSSIDHAPEERERGITTSPLRSKSKSKKIETGRVEKGGYSYQDLILVDMDFEYFPFHTVEYKLTPISQKIVEFSDMKLKCKKCAMNLKRGWNVCPSCGTKIEKDIICKNCNSVMMSAWKFCPYCNTPIE